MVVGNRSRRCRSYFTTPWNSDNSDDLVVSDTWIYSKEESYVQAMEDNLAASRETGLRRLIGSFNRKPMSGFVLDRREMLMCRLVGILKRDEASAVELVLACRVLELLALDMAQDPLGVDYIIKQTFPLLQDQAQGESTRPACAALGTMAMLAAAGMHTGDFDIEAGDVSLLDWLCSIIFRSNGDAKDEDCASIEAAALAAWTMLLTTLAPHRIALQGQVRGPHLISRKQHSESPAIRSVLALFAEASPSDALELDAGPSSDLPAATEPHPTEYTLSSGACNKLMIRTWSQTIQFGFLRDHLGAGFDSHILHNRLLHHLFDYVPKDHKPDLPPAPPFDIFKEMQTSRPALLRKSRAACSRDNELVRRAHTMIRNKGRSHKHPSFTAED